MKMNCSSARYDNILFKRKIKKCNVLAPASVVPVVGFRQLESFVPFTIA